MLVDIVGLRPKIISSLSHFVPSGEKKCVKDLKRGICIQLSRGDRDGGRDGLEVRV